MIKAEETPGAGENSRVGGTGQVEWEGGWAGLSLSRRGGQQSLDKREPWLRILSYASSWSRRESQGYLHFCSLFTQTAPSKLPPHVPLCLCRPLRWVVDASREERTSSALSGAHSPAQGLAHSSIRKGECQRRRTGGERRAEWPWSGAVFSKVHPRSLKNRL